MKRVVVTGMGVVTPLGCDLETFERRMFAGESGISGIRGKLVVDNFPVPYAGLVDKSSVEIPEDFPDVAKSRFWLFSASATSEAIQGLDPKHSIDGIVYGTAEGVSFEVIHETLHELEISKNLASFDWRETETEGSLEILGKLLLTRGFRALPSENLIAINSACASGNQALGIAFQRIRSGEWTRCLTGGVDARCNLSSLMNFHLLGAVTTADVPPETASRPFSKDRSGFVRSEGAATLLLETLDSAQARGAKIYGEVLGCANTSDAYRLTDGREDGASVVHAMTEALKDAKLSPEQVNYISAHGTSTPLNDRLETQSIKKVFGDRAKKIPISSLKSQIGHPTVAAGAIEAIASLIMLQRQKIAPTINLKAPDPECDLDYVPNVSREARVSHILSNSFGFGGQNSCVVLKEFPMHEAP